jgi:hypothetical protein
VAGKLELSGITVVGVGPFNPAIFQPRWFADNELLADTDAEDAQDQLVVTPQLTVFTGGWLSVQVTREQAVFATVEDARELELRDLVKNVFELLPHTPVSAVGINADNHFRVDSEDAWHELGDVVLPKDRWDPLFVGDDQEWLTRSGDKVSGLRSMTVESWRPNRRDYVRVQVEPSTRITPNGVYAGINAHYQLTYDEEVGDALKGASVVAEKWDVTRTLEQRLRDQILEWVP